MSTVLACLLGSVIAVASWSASAPPTLSRYREVALGDSIATVVQRLQLQRSAVRILSDLPSLVQEVTWRRQRYISGVTVSPDSLSEMVLTFHSDRLVRIVTTYDRDRVQGLSEADLVELLSTVYGLPILSSTPTGSVQQASSPRRTLATWADADTSVVLWRNEYSGRVGLMIVTIAAEAALEAAIVEHTRRAADGEPQRHSDAQAAMAQAIKDRDERIRSANKAGFKP